MTKAPWKVSNLDPRTNEQESTRKVYMPDSGYVLVCGANQEANAKAIAALPDLYDALQGLVRYCEAVRYQVGMGENQLKRFEAAKAALAKVS